MLSTVGERLLVQRTVGGRVAFEAFLVVAGVVALAQGVGVLASGFPIDVDQMQDVLAVLTVGAGAAAVGLGHTAGRLAGNRRATWLIPALALYCIAVVPGPMLMPDDVHAVASPRPGMLIACGMVGVLLLVSIRPPSRSGLRSGWVWALGAGAVALVLDGTGAAFPLSVTGTAAPLWMNLAVLAVWMSISLAVVVAGYIGSSAPLWRIGLGFGVIDLAHLHRVARPQPLTELDLAFSALRVFGVVIVLLAMAQLLRRVLHDVIEERFAHQEELRLAGIRAKELARVVVERDHELRNGLSGLTGMTKLFDGAEAVGQHRDARAAVIRELERLNIMLDGRNIRVLQNSVYDAADVLRELVALWTVAGLRIEESIPGELMVVGRAATLAQVMTNLLANCSRHAPGSRVQVIAVLEGDTVWVHVRDYGPSSEGGRPPAALTPGMGVGLSLCQRLLEPECGNLSAGPAGPDGAGFVATVELKAVAPPRGQDSEAFATRAAVHR